MLGAPDCALDEAMVTMRPHPAASMSGTAAWTHEKVPVRFTAMMRSQLSRVMSTERRERLDAGAGDEDADGPELAADLGDGGVDRVAVGDVDLDAHGPCAPVGPQLGGGGLGARAVPVEEGDGVAVGGELLGDAEADAGGGAGDDGDPAHAPASTGSNSRCRLVRPRRIHVGS